MIKFRIIVASIVVSLSLTALAQSQPGSYSVPVADPELVEVARMSIPHLSAEVARDGSLKLDYKLPRELDGPEPRDFRIEGKLVFGGATTVLYGTGTNGILAEATCTITNPVGRNSDLRCRVEYPDMLVNKTAAIEYIASTETDPQHAEKLASVVEIFAFKPIGIVETKVRVKKKPRGESF